METIRRVAVIVLTRKAVTRNANIAMNENARVARKLPHPAIMTPWLTGLPRQSSQ